MSEHHGRASWRTVASVLAVWFAAAVVLGLLGTFEGRRVPFAVPVLTGALLLAWMRSSAFKQFLSDVDARALVAPHLVRFVGIPFLILHARGELPFDFAVPGGIGDIAAAAGVIAFAWRCARMETPLQRAALFVWNVFGLLDLLYVVATAARLVTSEPESMKLLTRLPLSLLPTFFVPLLLFTHVVIFARLRAASTRARAR
jgi:hypothetical protein